MEIPKILDIIKGNTVLFSHYRAGFLYYTIKVNATKYIFTVPIDDIGDATFKISDKAIMFMRYIKQAIKDRTFVKV